MASANSKVGFEVFIDGQNEFFKTLEKMQERWKDINEEIKRTKESMDRFAASGDLQGFTRANDDFTRLTANSQALRKAISEAKKEISDVDTILGRMGSSSLKQMKSDLNTLKSGFKFIDPSDREKLEKYSKAMGELNYRVKEAEKATRAVIMPEKELQSVLANLKTAPIDQLKKAQEELTRKVNETTRGTKEWHEASEQLKTVRSHIANANASLGEHVSKIGQAISRLKSYVLVYLGFNKLMDVAKGFGRGALQLSDSIANVQKVTKMASGEVDNLSKAIDRIDTRSSQEQLHNLAYQAGMLGLSSQKDVLGFVKAADQMNWAMKEMGEDGAVQLMKVANLTKEIERFGVEGALTKIGSAINEITANSAADAKSITEIVSRLAQVGGVAGYTSDQMVALASTLSALNVRSEMGATALQRVMTSLQTNVSGIAEQLNVSADEIRNQGDSMQQLLFVLQKLKDSTAQGDNPMETLKPMFKDMGSDGVRLTAVLTTMVDHVDMLKEHLGITTSAFADGTSMLYEFQIKNETAAAFVERMGNAMRENFINSGLSRWLQGILKYMVDLFEHTNRHNAVMAILRGSLAYITVYLGNKTLHALKNVAGAVKDLLAKAWKMVVSIEEESAARNANTAATNANTAAHQAGTVAQGAGVAATQAETAAQGEATVATQAHASAWQILKTAIATHPFGAIATALVTLVALAGPWLSTIWDMITGHSALESSVEGAGEALEGMNQELNSENRRLAEAYSKLDAVKRMTGDVNKQNSERLSLIHLINARYGKYLSNQVSEAANYIQIEEALKKVNHQIRVQAALKFRQTLTEKADNNLAKAQGDAGESMFEDLSDLFNGIGGKFNKGQSEASVSAKIIDYIQKNAQEGKKTRQDIEAGILKILSINITGISSSPISSEILVKNLRELSGAYKDLSSAMAVYKTQTQSIAKLEEIQAKTLGITVEEIARAEERDAEAASGIATHIANTKQMLTSALIEDESTDIQTLVGWEKKLKDLANMAYTNNERKRLFKEYFGEEQPKTAQEAAAYIHRYAEEIHRRLKQDKYQDTGGFRFEDKKQKSGRKDKNDFDESEGAIAKLDAYYKRREMAIETSLANEEITEEEGARRKDILQQEHLERRAQLRKSFNKEATDAERKDLQDWWAVLTQKGELATVEWSKIYSEWSKANEKERATNLLSLTKDLNDSKKILAKMTKELHKALLEYDPVQKVLEGLRSNLDTITVAGQKNGKDIMGSLLGIGIDENGKDYTQKIEDRFNFIFKHMKDAVGMGAEELRTMMQGEDGVWSAALGDEELKLLLLRMEDFQDKYMQAIRQQAAKLKARIAQEMKESGETQERAEIERRSKNREESAKLVGGVSYFGASEKSLQGTTWTDEAALDTMRMKIQLENEYMYALAERQRQELEAAEKIADANKREQEQLRITEEYKILAAEHTKTLMELNQQYATQLSEDAMKVTEQISPYADAMVEFADKFGAAVFGSKEDRQQAAKDLLISVIDTTSKILTQYLIMLATKRTFNKIEQIEEEAKNAKMLQSRQSLAEESIGTEAGEMSASLAMDSAKTTAELSSDGAKGIGKEVSKHGLIGLAIGAAITLAMTALTSLIKGKINQSISEINSIAGVKGKKVAASMLTYAEGNYPVLGSDGVVYNAKREDKWQTKVYRSPHYGILGEKGPELIVDGNTTRVMMTQRPDLYNEIMYLSQGMRVGRAKVYATGNLQEMPALPAAAPADDTTTQQMIVLQQQLDANNQVMTLLVQQLANGITIAPLGKNGAVNRLNAAQKWMQKHGL